MAPALQHQSNSSVHGLTTLPSTVHRRMVEAGELMPVSVALDMCDRQDFTPFHPHYRDEEEFGPRDIIVRTVSSALLPAPPGSLGLICSSTPRGSTGSWTIIQLPMTPGHSSSFSPWSYPGALSFQHPLPQCLHMPVAFRLFQPCYSQGLQPVGL